MKKRMKVKGTGTMENGENKYGMWWTKKCTYKKNSWTNDEKKDVPGAHVCRSETKMAQ